MTLGDLKQIAEEIGQAGYADDAEIDLAKGSDIDSAEEVTVAGWFQPRSGDENLVVLYTSKA